MRTPLRLIEPTANSIKSIRLKLLNLIRHDASLKKSFILLRSSGQVTSWFRGVLVITKFGVLSTANQIASSLELVIRDELDELDHLFTFTLKLFELFECHRMPILRATLDCRTTILDSLANCQLAAANESLSMRRCID